MVRQLVGSQQRGHVGRFRDPGIRFDKLEVFDASSDLILLDFEKGTVTDSPLVKGADFQETFPCWSADRKTIYFCRAASLPQPAGTFDMHYDLYAIGFDPRTGRLGDTLTKVVDAAAAGKSVSFPKCAPDGRHILLSVSDFGTFPIWHHETDLWLYDLATGETHPLEKANSQQAESLHSWTANSHWFLFTSRRGDGLYSKVYLAAIDNDGNATKPFLLPQRNPKKYYTQTVYSFNTPDFTTRSVKANGRKMGRNIESDQRTNTTVNDKNLFKSNHQEEK